MKKLSEKKWKTYEYNLDLCLKNPSNKTGHKHMDQQYYLSIPQKKKNFFLGKKRKIVGTENRAPEH